MPPNSGPLGGTGTLVLGLLLVVVGGGQLVGAVIGHPVWDALWRLWPVLLIVMGAKALFDHHRQARRRRALPKRPAAAPEPPGGRVRQY